MNDTFTWQVNNPAPTAGNDSNTTDEDTAVTGSVTANDNDPDGDVLQYSLVGVQGGAANGTVTIDANGNYSYTPNADFNGTDTFTYEVTDQEGGTTQANVVITVNAVNDAPVVDTEITDQTSLDAQSGISLDISTNFSDIDVDTLTFTATGLPDGLSISANGVITGTIDNSASQFGSAPNLGAHTVTITAQDPSGETVNDTFTWQVNNPAPTAGNDSNSTDEDTAVTGSVTANDNDPDGDVLQYSLVGVQGGAANGTVTIDANGNYSYTPNADFNGTDTFTYEVTDQEGGTTQANVVITVNAVNDAPVVDTEITDQTSLDAQSGINLDISTNFSDIDVDTLTFTATGLPDGLSISANGVITGTIDNSASQFGSAPNLGAHTVTITAQDPSGETVNDTFTWQVNNPAPTAGNDSNTTDEDTAVTGSVTANDNDPDGDVLQYSLVGVQGGAANGTVTIDANGNYSYTPNADFNGTDTFTYEVTDQEGGTTQANVVITVNAVNDAPVVDTEITDQTSLDAQSGINLDISTNFSDIDVDTLTFTATGLPDGLSISANGVITGTIDNSASQFGSAPNLGSHTVTITAQDPSGETVNDTFTWQVNNPAPTAGNDSNTTDEDTAVTGSVTANDNDPDGDVLQYSLVGVQGGAANGTVTIDANGNYSYTPNADFNGTDTFTYEVTDQEGGTTQANVVITVNAVNDAPVVDTEITDQTSLDAQSGISLDISTNFSDIDVDTLTFTATGLPDGLSISANGVITGTIDNSASQFGSAPNLGAHTVTITAQDPSGETVNDTFTWQVNNPAPTAGNDSKTTDEDTAVTGSVTANDNDPDGDVLQYSLVGVQGGAANGTVTIDANGNYSYTPNADFNGTDTFTYEVTDQEGGTTQANVVITVNAVNDAPVVDTEITDQTSLDAQSGISLDISTNFSDIDVDTLTFTATGLPDGLSISANGVITGTIDNSASQFGSAPNLGAHTVTITAQDPSGETVNDTFTWQVNNPAPTAGNDSNTTDEDTAVTGSVTANDNDPDGDVLQYSLVGAQGGAANGTVTIDANGNYSYTPNADFNGTDTFTYEVTDQEGGTTQANVVITVNAVNDAPVVDTEITDQTSLDAQSGISLDISTNFSDIDVDTLTFTATGLPDGLSISANGVITGTIDNSASQFGSAPNLGAHTVTITAQDPSGETVNDTFTWQVNNPGPTAGNDSNTTDEDTAVNRQCDCQR